MTEPLSLEAEILGAAPDPAQVRALAQAVIQAAGITREQIAVEAKRLLEEREHLARCFEKLHSDVADYESHRSALHQKEQILREQEEALAFSREKLLEHERAVQEQTCVLGDRATQIEQLQAQVASAESDLKKREQALHSAQREVENKLRELAPKQKELDLRALDLEAQTSELEQRGSELEELREALSEMQSQLKSDHDEVSAHREELLKRLSRLPDHHAENQEPMPTMLEVPAESNGWAPKPASTGGVDQYRKLRRDAKRRAIGV
jgi:chromosome segregation ATPase